MKKAIKEAPVQDEATTQPSELPHVTIIREIEANLRSFGGQVETEINALIAKLKAVLK